MTMERFDRSVRLVRQLVLVLTLCQWTRSEFRFCDKGPQRFRNKDCPYGIYLPKPISTSCAYYFNDQTGPGAAAEIQSCVGSPVSLTQTGEKAPDNTKLQAVFMEVTDPSSYGDSGSANDECGTTCLANYEPISEQGGSENGLNYDEDEAEYDYMVPRPGEEVLRNQKNLTAQMFMNLIEDDDPPELLYLRSAKLLEKSMTIMRSFCNPFIPQEFTDQVLKGFLYLLLKSNDTFNDAGLLEYRHIDKALDRCLAMKPPVQVIGMVCNNYTKIYGYKGMESESETVKYKRMAKSFRWGLFDPFIEGAFAAMDFVNGYCFQEYRSDLSFHHIYEAVVEPLFTRSIMQRWPFPPKLSRGDGYWNNLLNVRDAKLMMWNLDACVNAGYHGSIYKQRLNRPFSKFPQTLGKDAVVAGRDGSKGGAGGYQGSIDQYWAEYDENDRFNLYLQSVGGECIKTEEQQNNKRNQLSEKCSI